MEITAENGISKLTPAEGMRLTDGETIAEGVVYLGNLDAPENWREVTEAEAKELEAAKAAAMAYPEDGPEAVKREEDAR